MEVWAFALAPPFCCELTTEGKPDRKEITDDDASNDHRNGRHDGGSPAAQEEETTQTVARSVHDARRLRQTGDLDGALAVFAGVNTAKTETSEARWAHAEWLSLVKRRFGERKLVLYSQGKGRAAALSPRDDGTLEVLAALGMRWQPGKMLSRRSLRGLRTMGGESWS